jgi:signal transduction histidine kinase
MRRANFMPTRIPLTPTEQIQLRVMADLQQMFGELRLNEQRNALVRELDSAILRSTFSPQQVLDLIVAKCLSSTDANHGQVVLYEKGRLVVAASSEPKRVGELLPLKTSLCGKAVRERAEQHYPDISELSANSYVRYHETTKSELVVLIQPANEARVLGVIDLERDVKGPFSEAALAFARLLAGQAAIAIEHTRIGKGVKTLYQISNAVAFGTLTLQQSCQEILNALLSNSDFEHGQILIREGDKLVIVASSRGEDIGLRPGPDSSVCGRYLLSEQGRSVLIIDDIERSPYHELYLGLLGGNGERMRSEMIVPLVGDSGVLVGALNIESPHEEGFTAPDEMFFGAVGNFLAGAILAALARQKRTQDEQIKTAVLAMTQLGNAATSFQHRFGSAIGDARIRLIDLGCHLAGRGLPPVPETASLDEFIQGMVDRLGEAAQVIQDFSNRFNPSGAEFRFRSVDLASIGEELIQKYRRKNASSGIGFSFDDQLRVIEREGKATVDSKAICRLTDKVNEVIENLLDNAVRAVVERPSGPAGGTITVTVRLSDELGAQLRVADNGVGIPDRDQPFIFDYDYSTRKSKGVSHGIGLWFCKLYALQVGGKLTFESVEGKGSWFEIEFPTIDA